MTTCARNLPQHFNGCTCTPNDTVTAEAKNIDLGSMMRRDAGIDDSDRVLYHQVMEEGLAWEDLQYAEVSVTLNEAELADHQARSRLLQRRKRTAELTTGVEKAHERVAAARETHGTEQTRLDAMRPTDPVGAADHTVQVAGRHSKIASVALGLSTSDRDSSQTRAQRRRNQRVVDHFTRVQAGSFEYLKQARAQADRARNASFAAQPKPAPGESIFDTY